MKRQGISRGRLERLERAAGIGACPACGQGGPPVRPTRDVRFELITAPGAAPPASRCETCGRATLSFTLNIGPPLLPRAQG